jgi:hypothetical protein
VFNQFIAYRDKKVVRCLCAFFVRRFSCENIRRVRRTVEHDVRQFGDQFAGS